MMIIDARTRPPYKAFRDAGIFSPWGTDEDEKKWPALAFGRGIPPSVSDRSMEAFDSEMKDAGITRAVVMGRNAGDGSGTIPDDDVASLVSEAPSKYIGVAGISLSDITGAIHQSERAVQDLGLKGLSIEPAIAPEPMHVDDERLQPFYDCAKRLGVPVSITSSIMVGPDVTYSHPARIQHVAERNPEVTFVVVHASWPYVAEMIAVAFRCRNVYIMPDFYGYIEGFPFAEEYHRATRMFLKYRTLFATSYPVRPMAEAVAGAHRCEFDDATAERVLWQNAADLYQL
jgi:predicted TIM-barrel fold metal-dependent hydrolase